MILILIYLLKVDCIDSKWCLRQEVGDGADWVYEFSSLKSYTPLLNHQSAMSCHDIKVGISHKTQLVGCGEKNMSINLQVLHYTHKVLTEWFILSSTVL